MSENFLIFKKYKILDNLGKGSFGTVFLGKNIQTNEKVAIKIEKRKIVRPFLEREAYILFSLKGPGIPELKSFGRTKKFNILVESLLGKSLLQLYTNNGKSFSLKDICMLGIQILERLEYIHNKNYIHRDIKPQNIVIGKEDKRIIYLIDFGLAKKYRTDKGKHVKFTQTNHIAGTPRFCSINALRGVEQSRKDDLESLSYLIVYFFKGALPWQGLKIDSKNSKFKKINRMKKETKVEDLCFGLPETILEFCKYIKNLTFTENPDYDYMKNLFIKTLEKNGLKNDYIFSWIKENDENIVLPLPKTIRSNKTSFQKKLFDKIITSLNKKKEDEKIESNINEKGMEKKKENKNQKKKRYIKRYGKYIRYIRYSK